LQDNILEAAKGMNRQQKFISKRWDHNVESGWLTGWKINVLFQHKNKLYWEQGGDLLPPG